MKTCKKCNLSYDEDKKFCKKCGGPLTSELQIDPKSDGKKTVLEDRLKTDPLNLELLYEYAQFLFNNHLFQETITVAYKLLAINENNGIAKDLLFKSYLKLNMNKEALDIGNQLLFQKPEDIFLLEELARISNELEDVDKSIEYYDKILRLQPDNNFVLYNKAIKLLKKNKHEQAIEIFKKLYQEGQKDRITTLYIGIDKVLNADYNTAINLLVPVLSDGKIDCNDLDNTLGFIYLVYSLFQTKNDTLDTFQWVSKIDFKVLKNEYYILDDQIIAKTVLYIIDYESNKFKSTVDTTHNIEYLENNYLNKVQLTKNTNSIISAIWYKLGEKRVELKLYEDSLKSFEKALELMPNEKKYKEKHAEILKKIEIVKLKRKRKSILAFGIAIIFIVFIVVSLFAYKNYQENALWKEAQGLKSREGYDKYIATYPTGKYVTQANDNLISILPEFIFIQGGTFQMEFNDSQAPFGAPIYSVKLSDFYLGKYEVTQSQWRAVMGNNPSNFKGDNLPVENVSWDETQKFINKLNALTRKNYRLPTEAEWEYAARGGNKSVGYIYSGSNTLSDVAWYSDNSNSTTHEVGGKQPNEQGLYDMSGNVWEWCSNWYGDYNYNEQSNPTGPSSGSDHVRRGGCWQSNARDCFAGSRFSHGPGDLNGSLGFRLASPN